MQNSDNVLKWGSERDVKYKSRECVLMSVFKGQLCGKFTPQIVLSEGEKKPRLLKF